MHRHLPNLIVHLLFMNIGNKIFYSTGETKPFQDEFRWRLLGWGELNQERGGCCTVCRELPSKKHGMVTNMQKMSLNLIKAKQRCCIQRCETEYFPFGAILPDFTLIVQPQCWLGRALLLAMRSTSTPGAFGRSCLALNTCKSDKTLDVEASYNLPKQLQLLYLPVHLRHQ